MSDLLLDATSPFDFHGGFHSTDLDEIRSAAAVAQHPLTIDLPGPNAPLRFALHQHPLSRLALTHAVLTYEGPLHVETPPLRGHYFLQIPLRGRGEVRQGARVAQPEAGRCGVLLTPGHEVAMRSRGGFEEITLEIEASAVDRAWEVLTGAMPDAHVVFEPALHLDTEPGASVQRLVRLLIDEVSRTASTPRMTIRLSRLEETLILCLLQGQAHSHDAVLRGRLATATASVVSNAEAWMEARAGSPITMSVVAAAHGVPLRSLQRAFERHRAYSPREFLGRVRMGGARARLRGGAARTVAEVALESGFRHLGRFSGAYRAQFGESPSATLRRARRRPRTFGGDVANRIDFASDSATLRPDRSQSGGCGFCAGEVPSA